MAATDRRGSPVVSLTFGSFVNDSKGLLGWMGTSSRFKSYFLRGLAVVLPTLLTLWILGWAYGFIHKNISRHINRGVVEVLVWAQGREGLSEDALDDYREKVESRFFLAFTVSVVGLLIAVGIVFLVGALLASVVGKAFWRLIERFIMNTPVLRGVYPHVKQVTDFLLTQEDQKRMFSRVVAVEYPRQGIWSIGFVTGSGLRKVVDRAEQECLTVLVPNSPTPVTGYVVVVPKDQTISLDMTIEEAFRFAVSAGVITPEGNQAVALPAKCETEAVTVRSNPV